MACWWTGSGRQQTKSRCGEMVVADAASKPGTGRGRRSGLRGTWPPEHRQAKVAGRDAATGASRPKIHTGIALTGHGHRRTQVHGRQDRSDVDGDPPQSSDRLPRETTMTKHAQRSTPPIGGGAVGDEGWSAPGQDQIPASPATYAQKQRPSPPKRGEETGRGGGSRAWPRRRIRRADKPQQLEEVHDHRAPDQIQEVVVVALWHDGGRGETSPVPAPGAPQPRRLAHR